jgi:PadR family transcriptional regulator, regulatory protein PadR
MDKQIETIIKGIAPHLILKFLAIHPNHGYAVIAHIRKEYHVYLGPSTVYPLLSKLQKEGFITSAWIHETNMPRKVYTLTVSGHAELNQTAQMLNMVVRTEQVRAQ